jgi:hypothetical protein
VRPRDGGEQHVGEERLALAGRREDEPERAVPRPDGAPPGPAAEEAVRLEVVVRGPARADERGDQPCERGVEPREVCGEEEPRGQARGPEEQSAVGGGELNFFCASKYLIKSFRIIITRHYL